MVSRGKFGNSQHFPTNLHILLDEAEKGDHAHIVSWHSQGKAFKIHDQEALVPLLAQYFRQTKFKSFLRQLQSYDFHRTTRGCDKGVVSHKFFLRGRRSLSFRMSRKPAGAAAAAIASRDIAPSPPSSASLELPRSFSSAPAPVPSEGILPIRTAFSCSRLTPCRNNTKGMFKTVSYAGMTQTTGSMSSSSFMLSSPSDQANETFELSKSNAVLARTKSTQDREINETPDYSQFTMDAVKNLQRRLMLECNKIAFSGNTSTSLDEARRTRTPQEPCLLSATEAPPITDCSIPQQVPSQQQVMVQTLPGQYHGQDPQMQCVSFRAPQLPQVQQAYQVKQSNEPQSQVQVQLVHYRRESKAPHQVQHQPIRAEQVNVQQGQYQAQHQPIRVEHQTNMQLGQYQAQHQPIRVEHQTNMQQGQYQAQHQTQAQCQQVQCQRDTQPQVELVCSEHTIENQIKELSKNMTKQLESGNQEDHRSSAKLQSQAQFHNISQKPQGQHQPFYQQQQQQQMEYHGVQPRHPFLPHQQQCEPQSQPEALVLQPQVQSHQPAQLCHKLVQSKPVTPAPSTNDGFVSGVPPGSRICGHQPIPKHTASYDSSIRSNDFDLSFCSTDFKIGSSDKETQGLPPLKAPSLYPWHVIGVQSANEFELASSFNDFASTTSTSTSGTTGVYSAPIHLTATNLPQSGSVPFSQHQQQPQHHAMEYGDECSVDDYNDVCKILETIDQEDPRDYRSADAFHPPLFQ